MPTNFSSNPQAGGCRLFHDQATGEMGLQLYVQIGENVVKGEVLAVSGAADNKYIKQTAEYDAVSVAYEAGSADGFIWTWTTGAICQVLYKDSTASTRGFVAISDAIDGRASDIDLSVINGNPSTAAHFKEIGHVKESKTAGTNVLVLIHFHTL